MEGGAEIEAGVGVGIAGPTGEGIAGIGDVRVLA